MLKLKIIKGTIAASCLASVLYISSCTKNFADLNTDQTKLTTLGKTELPYLFSKAQSAASFTGGNYQVAQNLFADLYAQYFATTATYFPSDRNVIRMDWLQTHWKNIYTQAVPQMKTLFAQTDPSSAEYALTSIWWVYSFHRVTDYYGPIPYFKAGEPLISVPYDAQDKIYDDFFKRLDAAVKVLQNQKSSTPFGTYDLLYGGNVSKWIKFANTLRLRLALRISKVDPTRAKAEAEAAVAGGVMETTDDDAYMVKTIKGGDGNGLAQIALWNEFRMSASMSSVLSGYKDPRVSIYFQPSTSTKAYAGLRNGLSTVQLGMAGNSAGENSNVGTRWVTGDGSSWNPNLSVPQNIMHAAEANFLRAEGALNGWAMGGTAKSFYEKGIAASMNQWGITDAAAIAAYISSSSTPVAPKDQQNSPAMTNIPISWASDAATQREQIGTQKWLGLYPDGFEAWAEYRRSGFPKLYPVVNSDNADLTNGARPRRIPFLDVEKQTNADAVTAAAALLGGPDKVTTPLWWDKN